jgi:hypothetical protein
MKVDAGNSYVDASLADLVCGVEQFPSQSQLAVNSLQADFGWTDGGAVVIEATTTNPTKGTTSVDKFWYKKVGDSIEGRVEYLQTVAGTSGSGDYLFKLPAGLEFDSTKVTFNSTVYSNSNGGNVDGIIGTCSAAYGTGNKSIHVGIAIAYDATRFRCLGTDETQEAAVHSGHYPVGNAEASYGFTIKAPISGWQENQRAPTLVGSVTSTNQSANVIIKGKAYTTAFGTECTASPCDIVADPLVTSVTRNSTGDYSINFASGTFSSAPICITTGYRSGALDCQRDTYQSSNTSTLYRFTYNNCNNAGVTDQSFAFVCYGER